MDISNPPSKLKELDIKCDWKEETQWIKQLSGQSDANTIAKLSLKRCIIGKEGTSPLDALVKNSSALKTLEFWYCRFTESFIAAITASLENNTSITELVFSVDNRYPFPNYTAVAMLIEKNVTLTKLSLWDNRIGPKGAQQIAQSIQRSTSLKTLIIGRNDIADEGAHYLVDSLKQATQLTSLDLNGNNISDEGARIISESLKSNASLKKLSLKCNRISDQGALHLAEMIWENRSLTEIDISDNILTPHSNEMLQQAMEFNVVLRRCFFTSYSYTNESSKIVAALTLSATSLLDHIQSLVISEAEQKWFRQMTVLNDSDIFGLSSLRSQIHKQIEIIELTSRPSKSPVSILLCGASSLVIQAILKDLKRPLISLSYVDLAETCREDLICLANLINRIYKETKIQLVLLMDVMCIGNEQFAQLHSAVNPAALTILCTSSGAIDITYPFNGVIEVTCDDVVMVHEYLIILLRGFNHTLTKHEVQVLAEKLAGYSKHGASLSPADISMIISQASIMALQSNSNTHCIRLANVDSALNKTTFNRGEPKSLKSILTDQNISHHFNISLHNKQFHAICFNQQPIGSEIDFGKLNEIFHSEIRNQVESTANTPNHITVNYLVVTCDGLKLGKPQLIETQINTSAKQTQQESTAQMGHRVQTQLKQLEGKNQQSIPGILFKEIIVISKIGEGAVGKVFKAKWHCQLLAIKKMAIATNRENISKEVDTLLHVRHKHLIIAMATVVDPNTHELVIVMEYMKQGSLHDLLYTRKVTLSRNEVIQIALDVAKGLHYLHSLSPKIIHRDLKDQNILLYNKGKRAKISDFGCARWLNPNSLAETVAGSLVYMAPEILAEERYDEKADIYSFGIVLFSMLTRQRIPIADEAKRETKINNNIDPSNDDLKQLILACCKQDPKSRPTASDCVTRLKELKIKDK